MMYLCILNLHIHHRTYVYLLPMYVCISVSLRKEYIGKVEKEDKCTKEKKGLGPTLLLVSYYLP